MSHAMLQHQFAAVGARLKRLPTSGGARIDVGRDRSGEFFELRMPRGNTVSVVDIDHYERGLLLVLRDGAVKSRFLCGFDERHWFVAAIPEAASGVGTVTAAKDALQPALVREAVARRRPKNRFSRRNAAYVRQGEWFFLPQWTLEVDEADLLYDEPLTRGDGKRHVLELAFRRGGERVFVNAEHPGGISATEFGRLSLSRRLNGRWEEMVRDPELYAQGRVWHPDHNTIVLHGWHRVLMNTEHEARAMRHVAFID